ncbi:uncharacterized protein YdgA (DUF945 family) [Pasteurella langaaensis DSM 22999]|uniref:Uncharacterized protein YdgA (DUF945 family) n=1 Tax=Alitibacter langaaensis DSM 22999 TaxID=1122935 RepID=A0A2U0TA35_9PAST|nr:YdgA family protein [Pasteurella langaaensis]PVX40471.1 uncharacterized protein YdgA (DUF945 family) [Pasteurella langaaensis DSM 22999]
MKKSTLALAGIIGLGAIWTGGAYYTGQKAESELQNFIKRSNIEMAKVLPISIENAKFERGIFSSKTSYDVVVVNENNEKTVLPFEGTFYHGPFPLNLVKKLNFMPAMFSFTDNLVKNSETESFFANGNEPFSGEAILTYGKHWKGSIKSILNDVVYKKLKLSGDFTSEYDFAQDGIKGKTSLIAKTLKIENVDSQNAPFSVLMNDVQLDMKANSSSAFKYVYDSDLVLKLGNVKLHTIDGEGKNLNLDAQNSTLHYTSTIKDKFVDYGLSYQLDNVLFNGINVGKLQSDVALNHLDAQSVEALSSGYYDEKLSPSMAQFIAAAILANKPQLKENGFKVENDSGKFAADLDIHLAKFDAAKINPNKLLTLFKAFMVNARLDKSLFLNFVSELAQRDDGLSKEDADKKAQDVLNIFVAESKKNNWLIDDGDVLKLNAHIDGDNLDFNGRKYSNQELQGLLIMLMMSGGF